MRGTQEKTFLTRIFADERGFFGSFVLSAFIRVDPRSKVSRF